MTFSSIGFFVVLAVSAVLYYAVPQKWQNGVLLAASFVFYACNLPKTGGLLALLPVIILGFTCIFTFFLAQRIARSAGNTRNVLTVFGVATCVAVLAVCKYFNFFVPVLFGAGSSLRLVLPLGISFFTFAVISYLVDVRRGEMPAETDFIAYCVFVCFFATITSGPICRAQKLLPQLKAPRAWDTSRATAALRLMLLGYFKQVAVANVLGLCVNVVFASPEAYRQYSGITLLAAAAAYAVQLYFEFAGYSDIARGVALLLGVEIPINFKTPYFATNFSGFWSRWHISLSSWLQDYIFTPLVWSRWTAKLPILGKTMSDKPPVLSSLALVFFISGFWHGNTLPFLVWGALQAVYRIGEELLHRYYKKPAKNPPLWLRLCKSAAVFVLWTESLIFFRFGLIHGARVRDAFAYLAAQWQHWSVPRFVSELGSIVQTGFYSHALMAVCYMIFILVVLSIAVYTDWQQCFRNKDASYSTLLASKKTAVRWTVYYLFLLLILAAYIMQSGGFGTVSLTYAGF